MMITPESKSVIPFRPRDAKRVGKGCYYLDLIVWLNSEFIELGDDIGFNYGCWVNGFGGLTVGDRTMFGPYSMVHTANHETDPSKTLLEQGHIKQPVSIGNDVWIAMGVMILPGSPSATGSLLAPEAWSPRICPPIP